MLPIESHPRRPIWQRLEEMGGHLLTRGARSKYQVLNSNNDIFDYFIRNL